MSAASDLKPGDRVLYVPHLDYHLDMVATPQGLGLAFHHHYADSHPNPAQPQKGDVVDVSRVGALRKVDGKLTTQSGQGRVIVPGRPVKYWNATVVRVNADGSADLEIRHPIGCVTLIVPDRGNHPEAPGVPHDPAKGLHTFHIEGE
jgi:hypothetical protein